MSAFSVLDNLNIPLLDIDMSRSGLNRFLPDRAVRLLALRPLASALPRHLSELSTTPLALDFSLPDRVSLGGPGNLSLGAGARTEIGVHKDGAPLFAAEDLQDAVHAPSGTAYVSATFTPRVDVGLGAERGPLAFGFDAGASLGVRFFQPFDVAGADPTLAEALATTLQQAVIPAEVADLAALPMGAYASVAGDGAVEIRGSLELASVLNPLATPGLPVIGSASLGGAASVNVGAHWRATGAFEVRAARLATDSVRLSFHRKAGTEVAIDATASVGISANVGDSDALEKLLAAISGDPRADLAALIDAGLDDARIEALQQAVARSVDRTVRLATELQFSSVRQGEALFAWDIDVAALSTTGRDAVQTALRGRLTAINSAAKAGERGIRAVRVGLLSRRERRFEWRINLFGVLNVRTVAELLHKGSLSYDPVTGTLNAADEIASERILVRTRPFEADGQKVRKLVFESVIVTAAYHASRLTSGVTLTSSAGYFEGRQRTSARDLREHFNALLALGLADAAERDRQIGAEHEFGPSTFLVDCRFDQQAADALFIGPGGTLTRDYYERIGRDALLALIPRDDADRAHRRAVVASDSSWAALRAAGPAAARVDLARQFGDARAEHIISDYLLIAWWSTAMQDAARALLDMRQFLNGRTADSLQGDPAFQGKRRRLEEELADVVSNSRAQFGDPWGVLALDAASRRAAEVRGTIVTAKRAAVYDQRLSAAETVARAVVAAPTSAATAREAERPLTADERERLRRHAFNLRFGAFSSDGEFQTSVADVQRVFAELLPDELAARKADGQKLRLLFYAHGGLTGERSGLEPVLTRLNFWRRNDVYPLSFVWETGLQETVTDIVMGLVGAREVAARGLGEELADTFLEFAARPGGKRVWTQMKRSAEVSALPGGGALAVAELTRDFWNRHHADIEIHAVGHSAGVIFQSHFLSTLLALPTPGGAPPLSVKSLHLLAPACTTTLFNTRLKDRVGPTRGIEALTIYTMNRSTELADTAGPYRKSLLYLVSRAFENDQPTRILGLEDSIREEVSLLRFFGLAGHDRQAEILFSKTADNAPLNARTSSTTHGGFDNDVDTMNTVMRRILGAADAPISDFVEEPLENARNRASGVDTAMPIVAPVDPPMLTSAAATSVQLSPVVAMSAPAGARRALCVGIDKYGPPYDLAGCVNDSRTWSSALQSLGFEVSMLNDLAATRTAVLATFAALVEAAQPGDVIVFQFAGHGTEVDDVDGDEGDALDEAFCPADFAAGKLIIDDDIRAVVAQLTPGVNLTCFIDCCHSGTITRAIVPGARPGGVPPGSRARYIPYSKDVSALHRAFRTSRGGTRAAGAVVTEASLREVCFSACQPHEVAYESSGAGQFTTRAMSVLAAPGALSNRAFMEQVAIAFGANAAQHPCLDCADAAKEQMLLQPLGIVGV